MGSQVFCSLAVPEFVDLVPCATLVATQGAGRLSAAFPRSVAESLPFHPALCSVAKSVYVAREQDKALNLKRLFPTGFSSERRFSREGKECLVVLYHLVSREEHIDLTLRYLGEGLWYSDRSSTLSVSENLFCQQVGSSVRVIGHGEIAFTYETGETDILTFTSTYSAQNTLCDKSSFSDNSRNFQQRRVTEIACRRTEELFLCEYESSIYRIENSAHFTTNSCLEPCARVNHYHHA